MLIDNVGIQYALSGLLGGTVTPAQFVDLNIKAGGYTIDLDFQAARTGADALAMDRVYRSGGANTAAHLDQVAIIDLRGPDPGAFHDVYRTYSMRARLIREHGTADNQVLWRGQVPLLGDSNYVTQSIQAMDKWLAVVEKDTRSVPLARKILDARKVAAVNERCTNGSGVELPASVCDATVQAYGSPRTSAGVSVADDTLKCQLVPLSKSLYGSVNFTDAQWTALNKTFPTGVCDYKKPGVGMQKAATWQAYDVVGGRPLGAAPVSVPFRGQDSTAGSVNPSTGRTLPTTGGSTKVAVIGLALVGTAALVRSRRRTRLG